MMKAIHSSEASVLTRAIRRHIPEDGILHTRKVFCYCPVISFAVMDLSQFTLQRVLTTATDVKTLHKQQHSHVQGNAQTDLDLWNCVVRFPLQT
jgi:hypothetical protein